MVGRGKVKKIYTCTYRGREPPSLAAQQKEKREWKGEKESRRAKVGFSNTRILKIKNRHYPGWNCKVEKDAGSLRPDTGGNKPRTQPPPPPPPHLMI